MVPSRVAGGLTQSSSSSGIFFQGDGQSQAVVNSHLSSSYGNSSNSIPGNGRATLGPVNNVVLNSVANSGPSVGASSLVTDANSGLSGGPNLQRSTSFNTDSYMRLPASPMSFNSNNISMSGSSIADGSSVGQQGPQQDPNSRMQQNQQQQGASSVTSLLTPQGGQVSFPMGPRGPGSYMQDPNNLSHVQKKPRLDIKQEDILQQQVFQQLYQRQDPMQLQGRNPQIQALFQQQRLRQQQQQQYMQALPQQQLRQQLQQQQQMRQQMQQQQQMRQQLQQQQQQMKRPIDLAVCARRLMQYLYHQRQRPPDNTIAYWRKFVAEYYSPRAKKRWCLSKYDNAGHALGVFPQASMDVWQCDLCTSKSGKGFEATFEVLPRLNEIKFGSGVIDELLFLDLPRECRLPNDALLLEFGKAVQESVYEQLRVVHEGQLRIVFASDLKILSWEFCVRKHEEFYPRRLVSPQVNQLLQVAQKCHSAISESGPDGVSQQDLQTSSNMVLTAGKQLLKILDLHAFNDLGYSKRYVRFLQISEVLNSMKDLIDFSEEHKVGPMDALKNYPRRSSEAKQQMQKMQEMEQYAKAQGLPTDQNTLNKLMAIHTAINPMSNNQPSPGRGALNGSSQAALALSNYQNMLMRQNSINSNPNPNMLHQEASSSLLPGSFPTRGLSSPHLSAQPQQPQQQQFLQRALSANNMIQQGHPQAAQGNQFLQQQMFQNLLQDMSNNPGRAQQQSLSGQSTAGNMPRNTGAFASNNPPAAPSGSAARSAPSRSNSFKAAPSNSDSSAAAGGNNNNNNNNGMNQRATELPQNQHMPDELPDISHEFKDDAFFSNDFDDNLGF